MPLLALNLQVSLLQRLELSLILHELKHAGEHLPRVQHGVVWIDLLDFLLVDIKQSPVQRCLPLKRLKLMSTYLCLF